MKRIAYPNVNRDDNLQNFLTSNFGKSNERTNERQVGLFVLLVAWPPLRKFQVYTHWRTYSGDSSVERISVVATAWTTSSESFVEWIMHLNRVDSSRETALLVV